MIAFVNAKINIGLYVTRRREDGYHDLETLFYPVGRFNGTPECPYPFCDILEIVEGPGEDRYLFSGRTIDCPLDKNLVYKAVQAYRRRAEKVGIPALPPLSVSLDKNMPDGAGLGGGSADASFTLRLLDALSAELSGRSLGRDALIEIATGLGADCAVFIDNLPAFASGIGEVLTPVEAVLDGYWLLIAKPRVYVSTREAFSGLTPAPSHVDLRGIVALNPGEWKDTVGNAFESTVCALHPEISELKRRIYGEGALYASMSGSGSSVYGIFTGRLAAEKAYLNLKNDIPDSTLEDVWLLKL